MIDLFGVDLHSLIQTVGYLGIFGIVFAESGVFIGLFLPGDSLLFTSGFLASQGLLNIFILCSVCFLGALLGDNFGYFFGRKIGPAIFRKKDSLFFDKKHIQTAHEFYEKHGAKAIIFARFLPIVRTLAPIVAGVGMMKYRTFLFYNFLGALLWGVGITLLGYFLGSIFPGADKYIIEIVIGIIVLSVLPSLFHLAKKK